jgi:hypothetical protein
VTPAVKFGSRAKRLDDVVDPFDFAQGKTFHGGRLAVLLQPANHQLKVIDER